MNSFRADSRAYLAMFEALGIKWDLSDLARHYSPNWYRVYRAARLPRSKWDEADRIWTLAYKRENPRLMPGARQIIRALRREFVLGVVTSGNRPRVQKQLREFALADYFSTCVCCEDAPKRKPHPAPLNLALERIGFAPEDCIYVGDTAEDIEMSRRAGVRPIGVLGRFPPPNGSARLVPMPSSTQFANCRSIYSGSKNPPTDGCSINFFRPLRMKCRCRLL